MPYTAPEALNDRKKDDLKSDIFSLGMIAYELILDQFPFPFY